MHFSFCHPPVKTEPLNNSDTVTTTGDAVLDTYTGSGSTQQRASQLSGGRKQKKGVCSVGVVL